MKLSCGFSQVNITPKQPSEVYQDGFGTRVLPAEDILDPVYAKVCVIRWKSEEFAIISMDICGLSAFLKDRLCQWICLLTGLDRSQFALCATHTHSAPACGVLADLPINLLYWNWAGQQISSAIQIARDSATPGVFKFTRRSGFSAGYNRRNKKDINRNIGICAFFDEHDTLQGVLTTASCHPVCMSEYTITADYPGVLTRLAQERYPCVPFLFLQGRGADIDPCRRGVEEMERIGSELAGLVFDALDEMKCKAGLQGPLQFLFRRVQIPMSFPDKAQLLSELEHMKQDLLVHPDDPQARRFPEINIRWIQMALKELDSNRTTPQIEADFQAVLIGSQFVLVFVPFEMLTVTGNAIEKEICGLGFIPEQCFIIGYANGTNGYLCPAQEYSEENYETRTAARWYMLPQCCEETELTVLREVQNIVADLSKQYPIG